MTFSLYEFLYNTSFTDIYIGWPGRTHDARVLANSDLFAKAEHPGRWPRWSAFTLGVVGVKFADGTRCTRPVTKLALLMKRDERSDI